MSNFVIFAHARSGSTSLANLLATSPGVKMALEPFNKKYIKWNPDSKNYSDFVKDPVTMNIALDEIYSEFNAIKVLLYRYSREIFVELLNKPDLKIVLLRRKVLAAAALSGSVAHQTSIWKKSDFKGTELEQKLANLKAISISEMQRMAEFLQNSLQYYEGYLSKNRPNDFIKIYYEDLFTENLDSNSKQIEEICDFLKINTPSQKEIAKYTFPANQQLNLNNLYKSVPNYAEIITAFPELSDKS